MKENKVLITGGAGFIGSHIIEHFVLNTDWEIILIDRLSYAGDLNRIVDSGVDMSRIRFAYFDIRAPLNSRIMNEIGPVDFIVHCAAETDVDKAFADPEPFIYSNFVGTYHMLEYAKKLPRLKKFIQVSTDEVYGHAPIGTKWKEWDRLYPSNPYAATKAGADCLALAYAKSYLLPITITRSMNNFGERQHIEGFVPTIIKSILDGNLIMVHGAKFGRKWQSGSRVWLHARNHADAIMFLLLNHKQFDERIVNIAGTEND